jgi:hypothetical protein
MMPVRPLLPSGFRPELHRPAPSTDTPVTSDWQYGELRAACACVAEGRLRVRVDGVQPAPGFDVLLSPYDPDPDSTADVQLGLYWKPRPGAREGAETPFTVRAELDTGGMRASLVRVYHASGYVDLRVPAGPGMPAARMGPI